MPEVLAWEDNCLIILDQTKLPHEISYVKCKDHRDVAEAIRRLQVRGAPAIGIAAAFGYALAAFNFSHENGGSISDQLSKAATELKAARPTAVNLMWAVERMENRYRQVMNSSLDDIRKALLEEALEIFEEEKLRNKRISDFGAELIPEEARILTYCNTGALATGGIGTALGIIVRAHQLGKKIHVYVSETRPVLQGARLTAWELHHMGVPYTLVTDNMAGYLFSRQQVDLVIVGADRIVANGDFANKIGTYGLAVLASYHKVPFYVAAPISTFDLTLATGEQIPVEMRDPEEVRRIGGVLLTLADSPVLNPSFDVTPYHFVTAYITDRGILKPPFNSLFKNLD
ncbi:MAG: S-methyl-5-thioribose-1-phosphate isomerase [Thermacetogeniaceae bacterium]